MENARISAPKIAALIHSAVRNVDVDAVFADEAKSVELPALGCKLTVSCACAYFSLERNETVMSRVVGRVACGVVGIRDWRHAIAYCPEQRGRVVVEGG